MCIRDRYNGVITGRAYRHVPGLGRCPEIRGRFRSPEGVELGMFTLVAAAGGKAYMLTFTVPMKDMEKYFQEYTRLIGSISAR